ncbi:YgjV family protein [Vibrio sp. S9_S30]|uniref:YgjV family protein n=1 Tax=Vibrio sp. S9_S30 TaxID=2720226 RepID=UPI0016810D5F|nr:YgjV family protein [Vibrio sp. S9_S30]MBD1557086.1 YgjV family protein [Vibrio sp. S9_S30]
MFAFLFGSAAFAHKCGYRMRIHLSLFQILLVIHFGLMGAMTAATTCAVSVLRIYFSTKTKSSYLMWFFIVFIWVLGLPNASEPYQLLTLLSTSVATWGMYKLEGLAMRMTVLLNTLCWLLHNIVLGSVGGVLMESTFAVINATTIFRLYRRQHSTL